MIRRKCIDFFVPPFTDDFAVKYRRYRETEVHQRNYQTIMHIETHSFLARADLFQLFQSRIKIMISENIGRPSINRE